MDRSPHQDRIPPTGTVRVVPPPGSEERSPAVSEETRARALEQERAREQRTPVRQALAFAIAVGVVGGLVAASKPWETGPGGR